MKVFGEVSKMRKIWILIANWLVSPYWYVIYLILSGAASEMQQGTIAPPNILDIIITILILVVFLPPIMVSLFIHNTIAMVLYYCISGGLICLIYYKYKQWRFIREFSFRADSS